MLERRITTRATDKDSEESEASGTRGDPSWAYLSQLKSIPLLTREDEVRLGKQLEAARDALVSVFVDLPWLPEDLLDLRAELQATRGRELADDGASIDAQLRLAADLLASLKRREACRARAAQFEKETARARKLTKRLGYGDERRVRLTDRLVSELEPHRTKAPGAGRGRGRSQK